MHASLSGRRVFNALCGIWPDFKKFLSFDRLLSNGWVNNVFFDKDFPHVWRGNGRIDETIFWDVLCNVFAGLEEPEGYILFHEKHAGWKRLKNIRNGVFFRQLADVSAFMRKFAFYSRRQWRYGASNDNYNLIFLHNKVFVSFTHQGELFCFSDDKAKLISIARRFRAYHLRCKIGWK